MKALRFPVVLIMVLSGMVHPGISQNKKLDKSLKKADGYYQSGSFSKALKALEKFRAAALKISAQNNYMLDYHIREARIKKMKSLGLIDAAACSPQGA